MKKLLLLSLLSSTIYANTKHCDATLTTGHIDLTTQDITIPYGTQPKVPVVFDIYLLNNDYKNFKYFNININNDVEGIQNQQVWPRYITYAPFEFHHEMLSPALTMTLVPGKHVFLFEVNVPRYNCKVVATSTITVTP